jgi:hypothetical protein
MVFRRMQFHLRNKIKHTEFSHLTLQKTAINAIEVSFTNQATL